MQTDIAQTAGLVKRYVEQLARVGVRDFYIPQEALVVKKQDKGKELAAMASELADCTRCNLCQERKHVVFGAGSPEAELVFVGEALF